MRRREFIGLLGSAAAWPLAARAQQAGKLATVELMGSGTAAAQSQWTMAFVQRMRELGWTEGRNMAIEYRWAEGRNERFPEIAAEFVRLKVDVILTHNTLPTLAAKQAHQRSQSFLRRRASRWAAASWRAWRGRAATSRGCRASNRKLPESVFEILRELVPGLRRLAILADVGNPFTALDIEQVQGAARTLAIETVAFEIGGAQDIAKAFEMFVNRIRISTLALAARLPTMYAVREYVETGGLMSYGPNWPGMWRRAADFVDKVLRGAKPSDLPVEQPTKFIAACPRRRGDRTEGCLAAIASQPLLAHRVSSPRRINSSQSEA